MSVTIAVKMNPSLYQALLAKLKCDAGLITEQEFLAVLATLGYSVRFEDGKYVNAQWSALIADQAVSELRS